MARSTTWTGFEFGDNSGFSAFSGNVKILGSGRGRRARTGDFYLYLFKPTASGGSYAQIPHEATIQNTSGGGVKAMMRVFFSVEALPSSGHEPYAYFGTATVIQFGCEVNPSGQFRARTIGNVVSAYTTATLAIGGDYELRLTAEYDDQPSGSDSSTATVTILDAEGNELETVTVTNAAAGSGPFMLQNAQLGGWSFNTSISILRFDDYFCDAASDADRASVALPPEDRISPIRPTGQGASADWSGEWQNLRDQPYSALLSTDQTSSVNGESTTLAHLSAAALGISNIAGVKILANAKASVLSCTDGVVGCRSAMTDGNGDTIALTHVVFAR